MYVATASCKLRTQNRPYSYHSLTIAAESKALRRSTMMYKSSNTHLPLRHACYMDRSRGARRKGPVSGNSRPTGNCRSSGDFWKRYRFLWGLPTAACSAAGICPPPSYSTTLIPSGHTVKPDSQLLVSHLSTHLSFLWFHLLLLTAFYIWLWEDSFYSSYVLPPLDRAAATFILYLARLRRG